MRDVVVKNFLERENVLKERRLRLREEEAALIERNRPVSKSEEGTALREWFIGEML